MEATRDSHGKGEGPTENAVSDRALELSGKRRTTSIIGGLAFALGMTAWISYRWAVDGFSWLGAFSFAFFLGVSALTIPNLWREQRKLVARVASDRLQITDLAHPSKGARDYFTPIDMEISAIANLWISQFSINGGRTSNKLLARTKDGRDVRLLDLDDDLFGIEDAEALRLISFISESAPHIEVGKPVS